MPDETFFMQRGSDRIKVTILEDGRVKLETDQVSAANHTTAERAIAQLEKELGGATEVRKKVPDSHHHHHGAHHHHH